MHEINVILGENEYPLKVKKKIVADAQSFFSQMDSDMDKGWQMSKSWVENPSQFQKCQIAADRLWKKLPFLNILSEYYPCSSYIFLS